MRKENECKPFKWLDYQDFCTHEVSIGELAVIVTKPTEPVTVTGE